QILQSAGQRYARNRGDIQPKDMFLVLGLDEQRPGDPTRMRGDACQRCPDKRVKILRLVRGLGDLQEQLKAAVLARQLLAFVRGNGLCLQARGTLLFDFARQASDRFIIIPSRHFRPVLGMRTKLPPLFFKHKAYQSRPALSGPMLLKAMNNEPDHPEDREFAHQAASASLAMPIIAILLSAVWRTNTLGGSKAVLGLACMGCIVLGMIFSIIALCNVTGSDSGGLVRRGLIG